MGPKHYELTEVDKNPLAPFLTELPISDPMPIFSETNKAGAHDGQPTRPSLVPPPRRGHPQYVVELESGRRDGAKGSPESRRPPNTANHGHITTKGLMRRTREGHTPQRNHRVGITTTSRSATRPRRRHHSPGNCSGTTHTRSQPHHTTARTRPTTTPQTHACHADTTDTPHTPRYITTQQHTHHWTPK